MKWLKKLFSKTVEVIAYPFEKIGEAICKLPFSLKIPPVIESVLVGARNGVTTSITVSLLALTLGAPAWLCLCLSFAALIVLMPHDFATYFLSRHLRETGEIISPVVPEVA
jgi:hypothetical protein